MSENKKKKVKSEEKVENKFDFIAWIKKNYVVVIAVAVALIIAGIVIGFAFGSGNNSNNNQGDNSGDNEVMGTGACEYLDNRDISGRDIKYVEMCIEGYGKLVILLDATTAPKTVENFISLVNKGFYNGLTFHRIMDNFMVQGGDPKGNGTGGSDKDIIGEFDSNGHINDISHKYGVISMARSGGDESNNYGRDTASSQFFICNADATSLDGEYAAFGYVVEGLSVIDAVTEGTLKKVQEMYGADYIYWLYSANGAIDASIQPKIKYVKVLDSWSK